MDSRSYCYICSNLGDVLSLRWMVDLLLLYIYSMRYQRILVKLSGEVLAGKERYGIAPEALTHYVDELAKVYAAGAEMAVVIGGGNLWRGAYGSRIGLDVVHGDQMGMLATMINAIALCDRLEKRSIPVCLMSRLNLHRICEFYNVKKARHHLSKGRMLVIGGGTSNPGFTTDSAGSLTAIELGADLLVKGTNVDGFYTADPAKDPNAKRYASISFQEALDKRLGAMDMTALQLCKDHALPAVLYDASQPDHLLKIVQGEKIGTFLHL